MSARRKPKRQIEIDPVWEADWVAGEWELIVEALQDAVGSYAEGRANLSGPRRAFWDRLGLRASLQQAKANLRRASKRHASIVATGIERSIATAMRSRTDADHDG